MRTRNDLPRIPSQRVPTTYLTSAIGWRNCLSCITTVYLIGRKSTKYLPRVIYALFHFRATATESDQSVVESGFICSCIISSPGLDWRTLETFYRPVPYIDPSRTARHTIPMTTVRRLVGNGTLPGGKNILPCRPGGKFPGYVMTKNERGFGKHALPFPSGTYGVCPQFPARLQFPSQLHVLEDRIMRQMSTVHRSRTFLISKCQHSDALGLDLVYALPGAEAD